MKKIFSLLLFFTAFSFVTRAQVFVNRAGPANTVNDQRLAAQRNFILPRYVDTAAANLDLGVDSCGALIYTRANNTIYYRQCSPKMWVKQSGGPSCGLFSGGIATWSGSGLTFDVTSATYCINDNAYVFGGGSIALNAANATFDRFDALALDNTGTLVKITGTPSANPAVPTVNPATQLYLTAILVRAGATTSGSQVVLWNENIGAPEYTASSGLPSFVNFNNTTNPYNLTKAADAGIFNSNDFILFEGTGYNKNSYQNLKFFIRLKSQLTKLDFIQVQLITGGLSGASKSLPITLDASVGFNSSLAGVYQNVTIPLSNFVHPADYQNITGVAFVLQQNGSTGFYLDYITLQGGVLNPPSNGNALTDVYKRTGTDSLFKVINGVDYFITTISGGGGGGTTDYDQQTATAAQTAFTFPAVPTSYDDFFVAINGTVIPQTFYTKTSNIVTFTSGLDAGDIVTYQRIK